MKKTTCLILSVFFLISSVNAQNSREIYSFNDNWKFLLNDIDNGEDVRLDDSKWRAINLPHDWSIELEFVREAPAGGRGGYLPGGIAWYRKTFNLEEWSNDKVVWIDFEGVYMNSDVWINGHHLGSHPYGYTGFYYDLTPYLKDGENTIAVRVDNSSQPNSRWYTGSGIYRNVWLTITSKLHIGHWGVFVQTPEITEEMAVVRIETNIEDDGFNGNQAVLRSYILNSNNDTVGNYKSSIYVNKNNKAKNVYEIEVERPDLWSVKTPNLYKLISEIILNGEEYDRVETVFGIRSIEYSSDRGFLLNGESVKMKGVCLHHDGGCTGAAVPARVWERRFEILKEMGCNAIRTAHNPMAPEFMDLCDRMGFLVMNEIFDEWKGGKVEFGYHNYFDEWSLEDLVSFVHRDRNHPSVVMWSAGNEIGEQSIEGGDQILRPLIETFHREDPTRPVTTGNDHIAADGRSAKLPFLNMLDVVGYNYVDRWHERRELYYSIDHHEHPEWKMVGTESVSVGGIRGWYIIDQDSSRVNARYNSRMIRAEQLWKFEALHDYVIGDFMWTGIDYLGESRWPSKNASSGVIDMCGFKKDGFYFYKSQWTDEPVIYIFPHWNWPGREGQVFPVLVYTNCDTVELFLNGKSFGTKSYEFPRQGTSGSWNSYERPYLNANTADLHLAWEIPYEPGILKAVGKKNNKIYTSITQTTGRPKSIRLSYDRMEINADSKDVVHITAEIVDSNNILVPVADNKIRFEVEGEGILIGVDNGNPFDHSSFKVSERNVFNGLALAIVQSTRNPGEIIIKAYSEGLNSSSLSIETVKSELIPYIK